MNSPIRRTYASNELAVIGALEQMDNIEVVGAELSAEQCSIKHAAMMQARADANDRQVQLDKKLRAARLNKSVDMKPMSDVVYTARRK